MMSAAHAVLARCLLYAASQIAPVAAAIQPHDFQELQCAASHSRTYLVLLYLRPQPLGHAFPRLQTNMTGQRFLNGSAERYRPGFCHHAVH